MDSSLCPGVDTEHVLECMSVTGKCVIYTSFEQYFANFEALRKDVVRSVFIPKSCTEIPDKCFSECDVLSRVAFASGSVLKRIGDQAFINCLSLKEIEIPASVEEIGVGCFMYDRYGTYTGNRKNFDWRTERVSALSRVTFVSGSVLKRIKEAAFSNCNSLMEIEIPASVEKLGNNCFERCASLTRVTFASGSALKSIGDAAFNSCTSLLEIRIPATLEVIGSQCFQYMSNSSLQYVEFESGSMLKFINWGAFMHCKALREIIIPENVESLDAACFGDCESLTKVILNSKLKSIGSETFERCVSLKCINIPASVEQLAGFNGCISLSEVRFASDSCLKSIGCRTFYGCCRLSRIEIPASVETLGDECFAYDGNRWRGEPHLLSHVVFAPGSRLKSIGQSAFYRCANIEEINIPAGVEILGNKCFCGCESLTVVTFGGESCLKCIGQAAFSGCTRIREIEIPAGVRVLPQSCFGITKEPSSHGSELDGCTSLVRVTFPNESVLECISEDVFSGCESLVSIDVPSSVTQMAVSAFRESGIVNINLEGNRVHSIIGDFILKSDTLVMMAHPVSDLTIPANIEVLDENCFANGSSIQRLEFESGSRLRHIARRVFSGCSNLSRIEIPANLEVLGDGCFYLCEGIECVTFERGTRLKRVGKEAFAGCVNLREIEIPASVEVIDERCFCYVDGSEPGWPDPSLVMACDSLCSVTFEAGSRLRRIEDRAFASSGITEIVIPASVEYIGVKCFGFNNDLIDGECAELTVDEMHCCKLERIVFEAGSRLKTIDHSAFLGSKLIEIEIPASVETLGDSLFAGYWSSGPDGEVDCCAGTVQRVTFQSGSRLKVLEGVFKGCTKLREIEIPASVEEIGSECFSNVFMWNSDGTEQMICGIRKVTFEEGSRLKYIHKYAFRGCANLDEIEIPAGVQYIGPTIFGPAVKGNGYVNYSLASDITKFSISPENKFYKVDGPYIIHSNSNTIVGRFQWEEEEEEEEGHEDGCRVYIHEEPQIPNNRPESTESKDDNKNRLQTIGPLTVSMDTNTLVSCGTDAKEVVIPANIEVIATGAFQDDIIPTITFESGSRLKRIEKGAFTLDRWGWRDVMVELPASVEEVDPLLLSRIFTISPESQIFEHDGPFIVQKNSKTIIAYQSRNADLKIPAHIEVIGPGCFASHYIADVRFAEDSELKRIGEEAFFEIRGTLRIEIPASVEEIGDRCFASNGSIYYRCDVIVPFQIRFAPNSSLKYIGKGAFAKTPLLYIRIPASVEVIDDECFSNCTCLECVAFDSGSRLKRIGQNAFHNCVNLRAIEIPASVEELGNDCFGAALPYVTFASGSRFITSL